MVNHSPIRRPPVSVVANLLEHILVYVLYGDLNGMLPFIPFRSMANAISS